MKKTRKLKNIFINPKMQIRHSILAVTYAFLGATAMQVLSLLKLKTYQLDINNEGSKWFVEYLQYMLVVYISVLLGVGIISFLYSIFWSHQLAGPIIPIVRHIQQLIQGNYRGRVHLRKSDELKEIGDSLNQLTEKLEKGR